MALSFCAASFQHHSPLPFTSTTCLDMDLVVNCIPCVASIAWSTTKHWQCSRGSQGWFERRRAQINLLVYGTLIYEAMAILSGSFLHFGRPIPLQGIPKAAWAHRCVLYPLELCAVSCSILLCAIVCYATSFVFPYTLDNHNTTLQNQLLLCRQYVSYPAMLRMTRNCAFVVFSTVILSSAIRQLNGDLYLGPPCLE